MEMVLQMLDARDLMTLAQATTSTVAATRWPNGAVFVAKRALYASEIEWFAANHIPVSLPPLVCHEDYEHLVRYWDDRLPPKYQWTLAHNGKLHRDHDLPAVDWGDGMSYEWWHDGQLHREDGKPAVVCSNGSRMWFVDGWRHRDNDLPAIEWGPSGDREWYVRGLGLHRENDQPAVVRGDGSREWWSRGLRHRLNDLPAVVHGDGSREWFSHGLRHREHDQPAIVNDNNGDREWFLHGLHHRGWDRPAIIKNGGRHQEWWVRGKRFRWWGPAVQLSGASIYHGECWFFPGLHWNIDKRHGYQWLCHIGMFGMTFCSLRGETPCFVADMALAVLFYAAAMGFANHFLRNGVGRVKALVGGNYYATVAASGVITVAAEIGIALATRALVTILMIATGTTAAKTGGGGGK